MGKTSESGSREARCFSCNKTDRETALFPVRFKGEDKWVCAKCIPRLIHG